MLRHAALVVALATAACQGPPPPIVDPEKLVFSPLTSGVVKLRGLPGAVMAPGATAVVIVVYREPPAPRTLLHVGGGGAVIRMAVAPVDGEHGFGETWLGTPAAPVQPGDEVAVSPLAGSQPAGPTIYVYVP